LRTAWEAFLPTAPEGYKEFEQAWLAARLNALEAEGLVTLSDTL
jgi:DNA-binding HxlR family transcriptional regulator